MRLIPPLLLMVVSMAAPRAAGAAGADLTQQNYRDWTVIKGQQPAAGCLSTISVGLKQPNSGLASIAIYPLTDAQSGAAVMTVRVPLGASLASGIAYLHRSEEEAVGLAWQYCDQRTCLASGTLSADEIGRFKRGRRIYLGFTPLPGSRSLILPVSLLGFTASWAALETCQQG